MKQIKILTYILHFALSNKYLNMIIQCLEPKIFNEKVEVLFCKKNTNKTSTFSLNIIDSKDCAITFNIYLIEQSPYYKLVSLFASYFIWFFFKWPEKRRFMCFNKNSKSII